VLGGGTTHCPGTRGLVIDDVLAPAGTAGPPPTGVTAGRRAGVDRGWPCCSRYPLNGRARAGRPPGQRLLYYLGGSRLGRAYLIWRLRSSSRLMAWQCEERGWTCGDHDRHEKAAGSWKGGRAAGHEALRARMRNGPPRGMAVVSGGRAGAARLLNGRPGVTASRRTGIGTARAQESQVVPDAPEPGRRHAVAPVVGVRRDSPGLGAQARVVTGPRAADQDVRRDEPKDRHAASSSEP